MFLSSSLHANTTEQALVLVDMEEETETTFISPNSPPSSPSHDNREDLSGVSLVSYKEWVTTRGRTRWRAYRQLGVGPYPLVYVVRTISYLVRFGPI